MKTIVRRVALLLASALLGCAGEGDGRNLAPAGAEARSPNAARKITILHVNDSHSTLDSFGPKDSEMRGTLGGLTRAATVIAAIRAETPNTLLLHAGDAFEGDLTFPGTAAVVELQLLKQLGIDAFTLGNHEFDYGPDLLTASLAAAGFDTVPVLSANLTGAPDHPLRNFVTSHVVKEVAGLRVGIFGLTTLQGLEVTGPFALDSRYEEIAKAEAAALRAAGADVIIFLSHLSADDDHAIAADPENGIDFIIGGHDEFDETFTEYEHGDTKVVRAGHFYQRVGRLDLVVRPTRVLAAKHTLIPIDQRIRRDAAVTTIVEQVKQGVHDALGFDAFETQVAYAAADIEDKWNESMGARRDVPIADLGADALKAKFPGAQIGMLTSGFINDKIYAGPVVANDLFRPLPYGLNPKMSNPEAPEAILPIPIVKVSMTGAQLLTGFAIGLAAGEIPQISEGAFACYDSSVNPKQPDLKYLLIDGVPVLPDLTPYQVATNVVVVEFINKAFKEAFPELGEIALPDDLDPFTSQFTAMLEYAAGNVLVPAAQGRVFDTADCMALLGP